RQLPIDATRVDAALAATGITPDRRPQTLAVGEWLALREVLTPIPGDHVGRRDDGFHDLHSVFVPLGLHDVLTVAPLGTTGDDTLHVTGLDPGPVDANLVPRAIAAARGAVGNGPGVPPTPPLAARLEKRIPV